MQKICKHCQKEFNHMHNNKFGYFCNQQCATDFKVKQNDKKRFEDFTNGKLKYRFRIYKILVEIKGNKCDVCGIQGIWNNKPIRLWVDHIDGDPTNNMPHNFRLICPNCESQTETSRGKNYGNGRASKGLPPYG